MWQSILMDWLRALLQPLAKTRTYACYLACTGSDKTITPGQAGIWTVYFDASSGAAIVKVDATAALLTDQAAAVESIAIGAGTGVTIELTSTSVVHAISTISSGNLFFTLIKSS